jgi:hypothetical protein
MRNVFKIVVGKPIIGWQPIGRPSHRWEDHTKIDFGEIEWEGMDWIHLAQGRAQ